MSYVVLSWFVGLTMTSALLTGCGGRNNDLQKITILGPDDEVVEVQVEVADSPEARAQGLMFRTELPEGQGMLFVFEEEKPLSFWMKNTLIPLDIILFDNGGQFVSRDTMIPCTGDPCQIYLSEEPAQFALEVPVGIAEYEGIGEGWHFDP